MNIFQKISKKIKWFGQDFKYPYKFKVFIMNQSTTMISRTAGQCAPRPMRWYRWVPHVVGKRLQLLEGNISGVPTEFPAVVPTPKATDILAPVAKAHKQVMTHRMALDSPTRRGAFYTCGCGCGIVNRVPPCPSVVHSCSCFFFGLIMKTTNMYTFVICTPSQVFFS